MRACIYTAIYGGYDSLKPAVPQSEPADFVCFTDGGIDHPATPWIICRDQRRPNLDPRLRAKWFKTHPHTLFPRGRASLRHNRHLALARLGRRYDLTIWIDGSLAIKSEHFVRDMRASLAGPGLAGSSQADPGMAMFRHPDRACIYDEAAESVKWAKYSGLPIMDQVAHYRAEGYPAQRGLMACGVLVCRTDWPPRAALHDAWWREIRRWTHQDQLSLPVVQWRLGLANAWIDGHLWSNPWFDWIAHRREEGPVA